MMAERRILVTGASSGLGREMARQLAARGFRLALTARREAELRETARLVEAAGAECLPLVGSVTDREAVARHYTAVEARWGGLDWAILNAGIGDDVNARRFRADVYHRVLATNLGGVVNWLEAVLPGMIAAGSGLVAGISSLAPGAACRERVPPRRARRRSPPCSSPRAWTCGGPASTS
jgi:NADP-dependent 3-hydroxy acid dehydrogenase YdfG